VRRAERLFQIVHFLRGRRIATARQLANALKVSERTIYRDVQDLMTSGVPIEGEAGVGYCLRKGFDMPPVMLECDEIEALTVGARMVEAWTTPAMAKAAVSAHAKIVAVLPEARRRAADALRVAVPAMHIAPQLGERLALAQQAVAEARVLEFAYLHAKPADPPVTARRVRPLCLYFWGGSWTLAAWCEGRRAFRSFHLDRIIRCRITDDKIPFKAGTTLADYQRNPVVLDD
jgi:predicted DNA-binding transcriptional regulator YafY